MVAEVLFSAMHPTGTLSYGGADIWDNKYDNSVMKIDLASSG